MCCENGDYFQVEKLNPKYLRGIPNYQKLKINIEQTRSKNISDGVLINRGLPITKEEFCAIHKMCNQNASIDHLERYFQRSRITLQNLIKYSIWEQWVNKKVKKTPAKTTKVYINQEKQKCRKCKNSTTQKGYLYLCNDITCGIAFWSDKVHDKRIQLNRVFNKILSEAEVPRGKDLPKAPNGKEYFAYTIRLKRNPKKVLFYCGQTKLHPYERYLNHLRNYPFPGKRYVEKYGLYMERYEGPMTQEESLEREKPEYRHKILN